MNDSERKCELCKDGPLEEGETLCRACAMDTAGDRKMDEEQDR